jgi:hypothetical protein
MEDPETTMLDELALAPWHVEDHADSDHFPGLVRVYMKRSGDDPSPWVADVGLSRSNAEFIALARNAFDVMMRRGWSPERMGDTWVVNDEDGRMFNYQSEELMRWPDPYTALVEADAWYKEHIEHDVG